MRIHHIALRVTDPERSAAFYSDILGLGEESRSIENERVRSIWLRTGDSLLMIERALRPPGPEDGSAHVLAFAVENLIEWEHRLEAAGVEITGRTLFTLYLSDPDGHRIGLTTYPNSPAR